jgi:hypothetical protein
MTGRMKLVLLAIGSGLLFGGFLYHRFGFDNSGRLYGWRWYQGAVLLAAIGLAGIFPQTWLSTVIALSIAPTLIFCYEVAYLHPAESMWPVVLPLVFLLSFPTPIVGSTIGRLLSRIGLSRAVYFVALAGALILGVLLPDLQNL